MTNSNNLLTTAVSGSLPVSAVPCYRLEPHARYVLDDVTAFVGRSSDEHGHILRRVDDPNLCESFSHEQFYKLRQEGRLSIERNHFLASAAAVRLKGPEPLISELQPRAREKLFARKAFCDAFLRAEVAGEATRSDCSMRSFIEAFVAATFAKLLKEGRCGSEDISLKRPPSPTTLRKWLRKYEACGFEAMALRDCYGRSGDRTPRFGSEERALLAEFAGRYASRLKPTKAAVYIDLTSEIQNQNIERRKTGLRPLRKPSRNAFERVIAQLDPFHVCAAREGEAAARKKFYIVRHGLDVTRPLERVEMDEWRIDLQTVLKDAGAWANLADSARAAVERARLWLIVAIDAYTRCILAARVIDNPSSTAAVATIAMAVHDKAKFAAAAGCQTPWDYHGTMETLVTDHGSAFIAHETRAAATDLGVEMLFPPAKSPQNRARIERFFRTIHTQLVALFDGRSFEDPVAKGDYESEAHAVVDPEELGRVIVRWIVDVYHNTPHNGLGGETPRNCWLRTTRLHPVLPPPDENVSRHIFGITVERRITKSGIRILGLNYQSKNLQELRLRAGQKPVLVRIDERDLGHVSVRGAEDWLTVDCLRPALKGVPANQWLAADRRLRREYADVARLSEDVVFQALLDIKAISAMATERAGIAAPVMTSAAVDQLERSVFRTFDFDRGPADGPGVLDPLAMPPDDDAPAASAPLGAIEDNAVPVEPPPTGGADDSEFGMED